jgi:hypothetical protein
VVSLSAVPPTPRNDLSPVTGRVTYCGRPVGNTVICFDVGSVHSAFGALGRDGSFHLATMDTGYKGIIPGRYRAHLFALDNGPSLPARFGDSRSSGLEIEIALDWNHVRLDLR